MAVFNSILHPSIARNFLCAALCALVLAGCKSDKRAADEHVQSMLMPGKGLTVYAAGDIADCRNRAISDSGAAKTAALISAGLATDKDAVVLTLGDNTYPVGLLKEFTECYDPTWGQFKDRTYPSPGNHEYYTPHAVGYYQYFGKAAGPDRRGYYSFRLGKWFVVSLNSYLKPEEHQVQLAWLQKELENNKTHCTLAFWHHPKFSSGGHGSDPRMDEAWKMLYDAGADVVLASHDHDYERFAPLNSDGERDAERGIRQFVVGTGGAKLTPFRFRKSGSEASDNLSHGVLKLILKDVGYEWEFIPTASDGFTDRGMALCH